jgi:hypothetical protein
LPTDQRSPASAFSFIFYLHSRGTLRTAAHTVSPLLSVMSKCDEHFQYL